MTRRALPTYNETKAWSELFDFTTLTTGPTVANDGVVTETVDPVTGENALKWTNITTADTLSWYGTFAPTTPFTFDDIEGETIGFKIRTNKPSCVFTIAFGMAGLGSANKKAYFLPAGSVGLGLNEILVHQDMAADPVNALKTWSGTGDTSANVSHFQIQISHADIEGLELYLLPFRYGGRSRPKVMFGIDNHSNSAGSVQDPMLIDMQALNWPGYMAWSSNKNPWNGATDLADTLAMVNDDGWTVLNHSYDHESGTDFDGESDPVAAAKASYTANAEAQIAEGFPANHLYKYSAQPQNNMTENLNTALTEMDFVYSRSISPEFIGATAMTYNPNWTGTYNIGSRTAAGAARDSQGIVDFAFATAALMGCSVNLFTHGIDDVFDDYIDAADWDYFMTVAKAYRDKGLVDLVSPEEWYRGLSYPRIPVTRVAS